MVTNVPFSLQRQRLGPLPIVNHFLKRLQIEKLFEQFVPTTDSRTKLPYAKGLGVLLRSILVEREPIYRQQETVATFCPRAFGLTGREIGHVGDDQVGRALDRLFSADRGSLLTACVVSMVKRFEVSFDELHNDSTTVRFCGQYSEGRGHSIRGRRVPWITYGHSKDHRPDLKQLLFILTTSADGGIPVQFRCEDGNTNDTRTHIETWEALRKVSARTDFLYVADSKLCTMENMEYIDKEGGRFVTVLPRSRGEDKHFRQWIQTHEPQWEKVWDRRNARGKYKPRDVWWVYRYPVPSRENWPITWVYSSLLRLHQQKTRQERLTRAEQDLEKFREQLEGPRPRLRSPFQIEEKIKEILIPLRMQHYIRAWVATEEEAHYRQEQRGRPGPNTRYRKETRERLTIGYEIDEAMIEYDRKSDGMYPLLTNDRKLTPAEILQAHKRQPKIEKRFQQAKSVHEIAPVFLKNEGRVEALLFLYFLALLVQALIERQIRVSMKNDGVESLPLFPEDRRCKRPTARRIFQIFSNAERCTLSKAGKTVQIFDPELTDMQKTVLRLLGVPKTAYVA